MRNRWAVLALVWFPAMAQQRVEIRVDGGAALGAFRPLCACFSYDEPNYTALSPVRVQIRARHLLVTGDGTAALKWGSTNAYTEGANGRPARLEAAGHLQRFRSPGWRSVRDGVAGIDLDLPRDAVSPVRVSW